jgi:hypothetical protein
MNADRLARLGHRLRKRYTGFHVARTLNRYTELLVAGAPAKAMRAPNDRPSFAGTSIP